MSDNQFVDYVQLWLDLQIKVKVQLGLQAHDEARQEALQRKPQLQRRQALKERQVQKERR